MAFPPDFLDELRLRVPVSQWVGRKVKLTRRGREHSGLCPFHKEKTPSFTVNDEKGFYHCFGCGAHGDVIRFAVENDGLSFPEAVERLAGEAGLEVPRESPEDKARAAQRASLMDVIEMAARWFEEQLAGPDGREARDYLLGRGLPSDAWQRFRLGYAPDRRGALALALKAKGATEDDLVAVGLAKRPDGAGAAGGTLRDYFFNRLIFPVTDRRGRVIAFGGRAMGDSPAKYINSPDNTLFHKGQVLYNLASARKAAHDTGELVVAEGYMDVIALSEAGFSAAVAPLGTAVTEDQVREMWRLVREPLVCLDGDNAGRRAAFRLADRVLALLKPGYSLRFCWLPEGEDPDSYLKSQGPAAFRKLLGQQTSLVDLLWLKETHGRDFSTPERRAELRMHLRQSLKAIEDGELREDFHNEMMLRYDQAFPRRRSSQGNKGDWRGANWGRSNWGRPNWGQGGGKAKAYEDRHGAVSLQAPPAPNQLSRRREQLLLALAINHPFILNDYDEAIGAVPLNDSRLSEMRAVMLDFAAGHSHRMAQQETDGWPVPDSEGLQQGDESAENWPEHLDSATLECHLREQGYEREVEALLSPNVLLHGRFARPGASQEAAREGFSHVLALFGEKATVGTVLEAARDFSAGMTEEGQARLQAIQAELREGETQKMQPSRYEAVEEGEGS